MFELALSEAAHALGVEISGTDTLVRGCSTDSRNIQPGCIYIALRGERFDGHDFIAQAEQAGAVALMVERPPVDSKLPYIQVADTRLGLGQLAASWRQSFAVPLLAVTGSNGKTTVKEMLRCICAEAGPVLATQGNFNNDIGLPLSLLQLNGEHCHAVIEMGANHAGEIDYLSHLASPNVALITQCAPAHLAGFQSIEGVARAKAEIFKHLSENGIAIINIDDDFADFWVQGLRDNLAHISFGLHANADVYATGIQAHAEGQAFCLHTPEGECDIRLALLGEHNVYNALAAAACALAAGLPLEMIEQGLRKMQPVSGRLNLKPGRAGLRLIDDTYNANPSSLFAAMQVLSVQPGPRWLILGDMRELGEDSISFHRQAGEQAKNLQLDALYAVGRDSQAAVEAFGQAAQHFPSQDALISYLQQQTPQGATLLFKGSRGMRMEQVVAALIAE